MKKVFYRCMEASSKHWIVGKDYPVEFGRVIDEDGDKRGATQMDDMLIPMSESGRTAGFARIERDCFEAHGKTWFKHAPGDPLPCDGDAVIDVLLSLPVSIPLWKRRAASFDWSKSNIKTGWRFADSAKPEVQQKEPTFAFSQAQDGTNWNVTDFGCIPDDESERNDLIAAVDDGHLTPGQKAYIQGKEDAQAAKQQLAKDALDKALQERADQLADAGKAMDRVNQDHGHRLGWMQ